MKVSTWWWSEGKLSCQQQWGLPGSHGQLEEEEEVTLGRRHDHMTYAEYNVLVRGARLVNYKEKLPLCIWPQVWENSFWNMQSEPIKVGII